MSRLRVRAALVLLAGAFGCQGPVETGHTPVRITPLAIEATDSDPNETWNLFDRDTVTTWVPGEAPLSIVLPETAVLERVKIHGGAGHHASLRAGGTVLAGPTALVDGWNTILLPHPVQTGAVALTFDAAGADAAPVAEIEVWALGASGSITWEPTEDLTHDANDPPFVDHINSTSTSAHIDATATACAAFEIDMPRNPAVYRRTWLRYRVHGAFRSWSLTRTINAAPTIRGLSVPTDDVSRVFVDRVDTEVLTRGLNAAQFCVPGDHGSVDIDSVELIGELDHGGNVIDSISVAAIDAIPTVDATELMGETGTVSLDADQELVVAFERLLSVDSLSLDSTSTDWRIRCVTDTAATEAVTTAPATGDPSHLRVTDAPRSCAALRLAPSTATTVSTVRVFGSTAARRIDFPQIVLASPREHFGAEAFVDGWVRAPQRIGGGVVVSLEAAMTDGSTGVYGQRITRTGDATAPWPVTVSGTLADGSAFSRVFVLDRNAGRIPGSTFTGGLIDDGLTDAERTRRFGNVGQTAAADVAPGAAAHVEVGSDVSVDIPSGATQGRTTISITHLDPAALPPLDSGIVNVTAPAAHGYEMLPHGQLFDEPVTITLPFQPSLFLPGYSADDVQTFYYDTDEHHWEPLARATVDGTRQITTSLTDHFTVMISAIVVAPEHPSVGSFDPNRMSGVDPASPGAGIQLIAAPTPNSRGDATLSYPLEVPLGRRGMQPALALTYSSERPNGWLGVGWDLPVSMIEVDTRWGVPHYSGTPETANQETETYRLDGEELSPVAHRGTPVARLSGNSEFHTRVEGAFRRIIRRTGVDEISSPSRYFWEVTDRDGVRSLYGALSSSSEVDPSSVLRDDAGNIFRWPLREVIDLFGNRVVYDYELATMHPTAAPLTVPGRELYLSAIHYTVAAGASSNAGIYHVRFVRSRCIEGTEDTCRPDVMISGRGGFVQAMGDRLQRIEVLFGSSISTATIVRAWNLTYETGSFGRSRLISIAQEGLNGHAFPGNVHSFSYYDDLGAPNATEVTAFGAEELWNGGTGRPDSVDVPSIVLDHLSPETGGTTQTGVTALSGTRTIYGNTHFYLGFDPTSGDKGLSVGGSFANSFSQTDGLVALVDIDGDGLPDRVHQGSSGFFYHRNLFGTGSRSFETDPVAIQGLTTLSSTQAFSFGMGAEAYAVGLSAQLNLTFGVTLESSYLSDVNADGLVDLVADGQVRFNRLVGGVPRFLAGSDGTPVPIGTGVVASSGSTGPLRIDGFDVSSITPPIDLIRRWQAPYPGHIQISGSVRRAGDGHAEADGVQASIEHEGVSVWSHVFGPHELGAQTPSIPSLDVAAGDRIYFRVHSLDNGEDDALVWSPVITYRDLLPGTDENGLDIRVFDAEEEFTLAGRPGSGVLLPNDGVVRLEGTLRKLRATSDDVQVRLVLHDTLGVLPDQQVWSTSIAGSTIGDVPLGREIAVTRGQYLSLVISSETPIDLTALDFGSQPRPSGPPRIGPWLSYVRATDPDGDSVVVRDAAGEPVGFDLPMPCDLTTYSRRMPETPAPFVGGVSGDVTGTVVMSSDPDARAGDITFAAKSGGLLLARATIHAAPGMRVSATLSGLSSGGGPVFFSFTAHDPHVFEHTTVGAMASDRSAIPTEFYGPSRRGHLAQAYRGWSFVGYNAGGDRGPQPVNPTLLETEPDSYADATTPEADAHLNLADTDGDGVPDITTDSSGAPDLRMVGTIASDFQDQIAIALYPLPDGTCRPSSTLGAPPNCDHILGPHWAGPREVVLPDCRAPNDCGVDVLYARASDVGSTHLGAHGIPQPAGGASAPSRQTLTVTAAVGAGAPFANASYSQGWAHGVSDFFDLNGDGFPDVVGQFGAPAHVQFTNPRGSLDPGVDLGFEGDVHHTETTSYQLGINGSTARPSFGERAQGGSAPNRAASGSAGGSAQASVGFSFTADARGDAHTTDDFQDVNGDGLPDRVRRVGDTLQVLLNLGYHFAPPQTWGGSRVHEGHSEERGDGATLGFNSGNYGFGGGVTGGFDHSTTAPGGTLLDMNGDGMLDRVEPVEDDGRNLLGLNVFLNLGDHFSAAPVRWLLAGGGAPEVNSADTLSLSGSGYFSFSVGPVCEVACYLVFNIGADGGESISRAVAALRDIDGDGYPDQLLASGLTDASAQTDLRVSRSRIGRTNLLREVRRPLGATIDIDYERAGNTQAMPMSRWVMSSVRVYDGVDDTIEGEPSSDRTVTEYAYENGVYDRFEREFYGFGHVVAQDLDTRGWNALTPTSALPVYRRADLRFANGTYAERGLPLETRLTSGDGSLFADNLYTYELREVVNGDPSSCEAVHDDTWITAGRPVFPALIRTEQRAHEGDAMAFVPSVETMDYDCLGNVTRYVNAGGQGSADDYVATISYSASEPACESSHVVGVPTSITVQTTSAHPVTLAQRAAAVDCVRGVVTSIDESLGSGEAITSLEYDDAGNLARITMPPNQHGGGEQRYELDFGYDTVVGAHVTSVSDTPGYTSRTEYDFRFGLPVLDVDMNGERVATEYDDWGRVTRITGPFQSDGDYTLRFAYDPAAPVPVAITARRDRAGDDIESLVFTDGLGRPLQTKRDSTLHMGDDSAANDATIVSGRVAFDPWGRLVASFFPTTEGPSISPSFSTGADSHAPTRMTYDVRDRLLSTTIPDGSTTVRTLALVAALDGNGLWHQTVATDAEASVTETLADARGRVRAVMEHHEGRAISTRYEHDALDRLVAITDAAGNVTTAEYDLGGRRTALTHPDSGRTEYQFDAAGNLVARITPNTGARLAAIRYDYNYTQLTSIDYPFTDSDVEYTWGDPGESRHRAGRVMRITDASGTLDREYDALGHVSRESRTIVGLPGSTPPTYVTTRVWDTWDRVRQMVYPNGELLTYDYDAGGRVRAARGMFAGDTFEYMRRLEYDEFEQGVFQETGNGIRSHLSYEPATRRLSTVEAGDFQHLVYGYDHVGDVRSLVNDVGPMRADRYGGRTEQSFGYDDRHRLTSAAGSWTSTRGQIDEYTYVTSYSDTHDILARSQHHTARRGSGHPVPIGLSSYDHSYGYGFATHPHAPSAVGDIALGYDLDGNLVSEVEPRSSLRRSLVWDEEDRIRSISDNGRTTSFVYDHAGVRTIKSGPRGETVYASPEWVVRSGTIATSHVYVGSTRVSSHIYPGGAVLLNPPDPFSGLFGRWWEHRSDSGFVHARNTEMNPHYRVPSTLPPGGRPNTNFIYFYHPDHLGSTEFVTDGDGEIYEHVQYFPSGETWVRQDDNADRLPWLFTSQQLDSETGLYYLGARYYDPRIGVFASTDPALSAEYLGGTGLYDTYNLSAYSYAHDSPIVYSDPNGRCLPWCAVVAVLALLGTPAVASSEGTEADEVSAHHPSDAALTGRMAVAAATAPSRLASAGLSVADQAIQDADRGEVSSGEDYALAAGTGFVLGPGRGIAPSGGRASRGILRSIGQTLWESRAGLRYGPDAIFGNRVAHVLRHAVDDLTRVGRHGVFDAGRRGALAIVDEAWTIARAGGPRVRTSVNGNRTTYVVDMMRRVGYVGGQEGASMGNPAANFVVIVVQNGRDLITSFATTQ